MSKDGYAWWRARMTRLERYFSAMRVDHVLGFFRIWELPAHARVGRMGRFRPSVPIRRHELDARGLWFIDRLCEPHITAATLRDVLANARGRWRVDFCRRRGRALRPTAARRRRIDSNQFATEESLLGSDASACARLAGLARGGDGVHAPRAAAAAAQRLSASRSRGSGCVLSSHRDGEDDVLRRARGVGAARAVVAARRLLSSQAG